MYGALLKGMDATGLSNPNFDNPFGDMTLSLLRSKLQQIKSPVWYSWRQNYEHPCNLENIVMAIADEVDLSVKGLDLNN